MKYIKILLLLNIIVHPIFMQGVCNQGSLVGVSGSPFSAGTAPEGIAFSPIVAGNVFAAVANNTSGNVSVYSVNTTTGVFTGVSGSPFTAGTQPIHITFSPLVYENIFAAVTNFGSNNVSVYQVNINTGSFTQVSGSPFSTGTNPFGIAFSPLINGNLFAAVANFNSNNISVYSVNTLTGVFTPISGSPFSAGTNPEGVTFSSLINGNLFAAAGNTGTSNISVYSVNTSTGLFTQVSGSPFAAGTGTRNPSFSPIVSGNLFIAIVNQSVNTVSVYSVNSSTGALTQVSGSPFSSGTSPNIVAYSPQVGGSLFAAVANISTSNVSVYQVNTSTGTFTQVSGSPFSSGTNPFSVAFSPLLSGGLFAATANSGSANSSVFQVNTLIPTLTTLSQYILSGATISITGTIQGGTANYAITWQDGTVQSSISTTTFSRAVTPASTTIYDVATISDSLACTAGPSNSVTIGVRTCP